MGHDIRYALRNLLKNPGFAAVAIVTLALGIAATTAVFSVVNGVLLRPLPYQDPERVVQVWSSTKDEPRESHAAADFLDLKRGNRSLSVLAGYREDAITIASGNHDPIRVGGSLVTADFFDVFGMPAVSGRAFTAADAGGEPLVVISETLWTNEFGRDPAIVGSRVRVNTAPHTVAGVMPAAFKFPAGSRVWVLAPKAVPAPPVDVPGDLLVSRQIHFFQAVGRVKPTVTVAQAQADLTAIADGLAKQFPETNGGRTVTMAPLREGIVSDVREALFILFGAVGVVLLIACANVASLLLARASGRQREMAVRAALGARRGRLVRQLVTESLLLATIGGALGLLAGIWAVDVLTGLMPDGLPRADEIGLDGRVAIVSVLITYASAILFGLVPSLSASRTDAVAALRGAGDRASTAGRRRARTRAGLVIGEVALTVVLMVAAGLLANSFYRLRQVNPGFRTEGVTIALVPLPQARYVDGTRQADAYERILETVQQRGGVRSAALSFPSPLEGASAGGRFVIEGQQESRVRGDRPFAALMSVSGDYFATMGIPVVGGRTFTQDDRPPATTVVIVNTLLARKYFGGENPIGKRIRFGAPGEPWITIVGLVADTRNMGVNEDPSPVLYVPFRHFTLSFMNVVVRAEGGTDAAGATVRDAVKLVDSELAVDQVVPMQDVLRESIAADRFMMLLVAAFGLSAVLLAAVGLYGLISYSVAQRTREIGIRVALGARPGQVMTPVIREGMMLAGIGVALGIAFALASTKLIAAYLFGVGPTDPLTFGAVTALLLGVALLASYIPSRRALRVDPLIALRAE
jgi:putative ABC transport system permease protein